MKHPGLNALLLAALAAATAAPNARAQSSIFLEPRTHTAQVGDAVIVRAITVDGTQARASKWPTPRITWLFVRSPAAQTNRENHGPDAAVTDGIVVSSERPGVTVVGLDTLPEHASFSASAVRAFAERVLPEGVLGDQLVSQRDNETIMIRRIESAKTLIRVGSEDARPRPSAVAQSKTGQVVEIRPLADPTMAVVGCDLPLRAYVNGSKQAGVKLIATSLASGRSHTALTDSSGSCHFHIDATGVWRIEFHFFGPGATAECDWTVYGATLTFAVTNAGAAK